jgi:hypothetical protein
MIPAKQYQNISYKELIALSENNPNRSFALDSIEIQKQDVNAPDAFLVKMGLPTYTMTNIHPVGILGVITYISDPGSYYLAPKNVRTQLIIDLTTSLQQQTDDLKNTPLARKRKRIYDLLGGAYNCAPFEDKDYYDLFHGLTYMCKTQFVLIKEAVQDSIEEGKTSQASQALQASQASQASDSSYKGEIIFSSDPTMWKRENSVWIVDYRGRWVATPSEGETLLGSWLGTMEQNGWIVQWPEVDGSKVELVEKLSRYPTWQETDKKLTKDVLAVRLGKADTLQLFSSWV